MRYIITFLFFAVSLISMGCDSKDSAKKATSQQAQAVDMSTKIEVVENSDFKKEKVAKKLNDSNESQNFYYDYHQGKEHNQTTVDEKNYTPVDAALNIRSPYEQVEISMLVSKLSKNFMVKCSACHDDYANGIIGPSLLNKDGQYIYETIVKFKTGEKQNVLMKDLVQSMSNQEIKSLADEIYIFNQEIKKIKARK